MSTSDRVGSLSITSGVVADLSATADTPFGLYLAGPTDPLSDEARELERVVFFETFGNTASLLEKEYGPFDDCSVFVVVVDHGRSCVAGMIRLILDKHGRLKSIGDIEGEPWNDSLADVLERSGLDDFDPSETLDGATLAVDPAYRKAKAGDLVSFALYRGMCSLSRAADMRWFVTIFDVKVLDAIQRSMRKPFSYFDGIEPLRYLDSPASVPVYLDLVAYSERERAIDPEWEALMFSGKGMEETVSPADYERAAEVVRSLTSTPTIDLRDPATRSVSPEAHQSLSEADPA